MGEFEDFIKAKYPVDYESLKEKYPNVPIVEFYGDEQDVWNHQQSKIEQLEKEKQHIQKRFNFLLDKNICNESDHASLKLRIVSLLSKWRKDLEHADNVASEDFVQNVLDGCIDALEKALRGECE